MLKCVIIYNIIDSGRDYGNELDELNAQQDNAHSQYIASIEKIQKSVNTLQKMRADLTKLLTNPGNTRLETMPGVTEEMILRSFEDVFYDMWTEITRIRGFSYQKVIIL